MPYKEIPLKPGVSTTRTETANAGGLSASNLIRSNEGMIERIAGWQRLFSQTAAGAIRAMHAWKDLQGVNNLLLGTDNGPQLYADGDLYNSVLARKNSTVTAPFQTQTSGSALVQFTDTAHGATGGDLIRLSVQTGGAPAGWQTFSTGASTSLYAVAWSGSIFCVVGSSGVIRTSPDGVTWTNRTSGTANFLYGVTWSGTQFCTVGDAGRILLSSDGITWVSVASGTAQPLEDVVWTGTQFVAVGAAGVILTSPTGAVWTSRASGTAQNLRNIAWNGSLLVVVGETGTILTSPDGITWTARTSSTTNNLSGVAWGASTFVVASFGAVLTSADGITWASVSLPISVQYTFATFGGGAFLVGGATATTSEADSTAALFRSSNGATWTEEACNFGALLRNAAYGSAYFVGVGDSANAIVSADGIFGQQLRLPVANYTIASIAGPNAYTITAPATAVVSSSVGGYAPLYVANAIGVSPSSRIRCYLQNHGLTAGQTHTVSLVTSLSAVGITLSGDYTVTTVLNSYTFEFDCGQTPSSGAITRSFENAGGVVIQYYAAAPFDPQNWFLDNLGENGIINPQDGPIYLYEPPVPASGLVTAEIIPDSPTVNAGSFVAMPQAQIVAFGSEEIIGGGVQDPLLVRWSDAGSFSVWIAAPDNLAGSYRLSRGSRIVGGIQAPQVSLLWTDIDCWSMQYVGPDAVYSFLTIGTGCGLISPKARAIQGRNTYWMSPRGFFAFGDSGVQPISCPVWDTIFYDLDTSQTNKIWAWSNSTRHEVFFFYPSASGGTGEIDKYVKMNTIDGSWDYGTLCRTSGIDESVFGLPLAADQAFRVQQHEIGFDADGTGMAGAFVQTGYVSLMEGEAISFIDAMQPDLKWLGSGGGSVNVTIYARTTPAGITQTFGPYSVTSTAELVPLRIRARQVAMRYDWTDTMGYSARIGLPRVRITASGRAP